MTNIIRYDDDLYPVVEIGQHRLAQGDCLEVMADLPDNSVDMILCDLPYGTTACKWDTVIPFDALWDAYHRIAKPTAPIVLTASQPFSTTLAASNIKNFKYSWVWKKPRPSNPQLAKKQPMKYHEDILVFYRKFGTYNPQGLIEIPLEERKVHKPEKNSLGHCQRKEYVQTHTNYPSAIIEFPAERGLHPTQKPVGLMEYLIETYSNPGDTILDNTMGSGTTGVACQRTGRKFLGIEQDEKYFDTCCERIAEAVSA